MRRVVAILSIVALVWAVPAIAQLVKPTEGKHAANTANPKFEKDGTTIQKGFEARHKSFNERIKKGNVDLVFIGDSITQGLEGAGKEVWAKNYASRNAVNLESAATRPSTSFGVYKTAILTALNQGRRRDDRPPTTRAAMPTRSTDWRRNRRSRQDNSTKVAKDQGADPGHLPRGEKTNPQREKNAEASAVAAKWLTQASLFPGHRAEILDR